MMERNTARVECPAQERSTMTLARDDLDCRHWDPEHQLESYIDLFFIYINYYIIFILEHQTGETFFLKPVPMIL